MITYLRNSAKPIVGAIVGAIVYAVCFYVLDLDAEASTALSIAASAAAVKRMGPIFGEAVTSPVLVEEPAGRRVELNPGHRHRHR